MKNQAASDLAKHRWDNYTEEERAEWAKRLQEQGKRGGRPRKQKEDNV